MAAVASRCHWSQSTAPGATKGHILKRVTLLTTNFSLWIAHPPVRLKYCCDRLSLSFIRKWLFSVTSDLFCHCGFQSSLWGIFHERIQWLKGGNRLIKVAWCHYHGVRNRKHRNLSRAPKTEGSSILRTEWNIRITCTWRREIPVGGIERRHVSQRLCRATLICEFPWRKNVASL